MKVIAILFVPLLLMSAPLQAQNPLPLLRAYRYDINNNNINLSKELEGQANNLMFTNIFVRYMKNPQYNQTFSPVKIMLFRIKYEHLFQTKIGPDNNLQFDFPLDKDVKIVNSKIVTFATKDGKSWGKKVKRKSYDIVKAANTISFKIDPDILKTGDVIRIYWEIESVNFNVINIDICQLTPNVKQYVALNLPEIFTYQMDDPRLKLMALKDGDMLLKRFSYNVARLVENAQVINRTYKWQVVKNENNGPIKFPLISINLPLDIGTSAEEILHP